MKKEENHSEKESFQKNVSPPKNMNPMSALENRYPKLKMTSNYRVFSTGNDEFIQFADFGPQQTSKPTSGYSFSTLVDVSLIHQLMDLFYAATGIPCSIYDINAETMDGIGWQDLCARFHRVHPQTACRCRQSDKYISNHLQNEPYAGSQCLNGLMDYATPIIIEGQHLATIFTGQLLHSPPDDNYFRQQAREYGFDEAAYMEALHRIPIIPEYQIKSIMDFYAQLGQVLASIGLERKHRLDAAAQIVIKQEDLSKVIFSQAFHCYPDPAAVISFKNGRYIEVNEAFLATLGYERHEVVGRTSSELCIGLDPDFQKNLARQLQECGSIRNLEVKICTRNGMVMSSFLYAKIIEADEPYVLAINKNITDYKQMEQALYLSEERFAKAFNACPISMTITTLHQGRFINVNSSFCQVFAAKRVEILGLTSIELGFWLDPNDRRRMVEMINLNGSVRNLEIDFRKKTGEQRRGLYNAERLDIDGNPCLLSTVTDITEQKQMEAEMLRMDRLNLVSEMAASIGHEIRNPMTAIRGFLQIMKENNDYRRDHEYFDLMIEELDRASSIINEFLSLAKNKLSELKPVNLNSLLKTLFPLIQANAMVQDKSILLETQEAPDLLMDEKEIRQLVLNMVHNGLESMNPGGNVTIKTFLEKGNVVLAIKDQGYGISREFIDRLGTPFFTTKEQGTGLGLAVCYGIAKRHNARIDLETCSSGTTFFVRFPNPIFASGEGNNQYPGLFSNLVNESKIN